MIRRWEVASSLQRLLHIEGHSLGGALATLAALEIRMAIPDHTKLDISCYTFGAPRTGNHAFAREYNKAVPDTWGVINDQVFNPSVIFTCPTAGPDS